MLLFLLVNAAFLASFAWLSVSGVGLSVWALWLLAWFAADYLAIWITGFEPPAWAWGGVLVVLVLIWIGFGYLPMEGGV
ncbi:hypothetical protein [Aliiroseovarius sp.]|uniref:hypothetical protein n=1 Tax=Aliiroseovarius sp. TaxID=1872442 RepID=UPI003BA8E9A2